MALTVRNVVENCLYRFIAKEQRTIPHVDTDYVDPLPEALAAMNGALQEMAILSPIFAAKQQRSAYFRAPVSVAVSAMTRGAKVATATWPTGAAGCLVQLPGDTSTNRILSISGSVATLQFPHLSDDTAGTATLSYDSCDLDSDVVIVLEPVRDRAGQLIRPANGRHNLTQPNYDGGGDFGRSLIRVTSSSGSQAYFVETAILAGQAPQLRMMLRSAPSVDMAVEFQARCSLGHFTSADVYGDPTPTTAIPVAATFVESIFQPLALFRFFGSSVMRNVDVPSFVAKQAETAREMLRNMKPQSRKEGSIYPAL